TKPLSDAAGFRMPASPIQLSWKQRLFGSAEPQIPEWLTASAEPAAMSAEAWDSAASAEYAGLDEQALLSRQEQDGSWPGRWGVNYVWGTSEALRRLRELGVSDREAPVLRGGEWLRSVQNADGGWGESCASYSARMLVEAPSTPSQTAWAVLGLLNGGDRTSLSLENGMEYLIRTQRPDGSWHEEAPTATLNPESLYCNHSLLAVRYPLQALSSFLEVKQEVA
ncbi:MAG TPA: prenyltransferase/squalene oxidase repeat-containing protein, partial [Bryobacteraceae bacterium]|nr:prenyltransferase/squalene oxidase repeat-containing protein [Bryobacteraceae bacterium]